MKKIVAAIFGLVLASSCSTYLPHTGFAIQNAPIEKPVYQGKDTSAFGVKAGYNNITLRQSDAFFNQSLLDSLGDGAKAKLNSYFLEASWSKSNDWLNYGFGAFGYFGNNFVKTESDKYNQTSFSGLGGKAAIGVTVHQGDRTWHVLNVQTSVAYDMGDYPDYRDQQRIALANNPEQNIVVPGEALTTSFAFSTQGDFGTRGKVGGSINAMYFFNGYWDEKYTNYGSGFRLGPQLRVINTRFSFAFVITNYTHSGLQFGLTQMF